MLSALLAPYGAASFLKEGYLVYGFANASQHTERYYCSSEKRKSKLRSVYTYEFKNCIISLWVNTNLANIRLKKEKEAYSLLCSAPSAGLGLSKTHREVVAPEADFGELVHRVLVPVWRVAVVAVFQRKARRRFHIETDHVVVGVL